MRLFSLLNSLALEQIASMTDENFQVVELEGFDGTLKRATLHLLIFSKKNFGKISETFLFVSFVCLFIRSFETKSFFSSRCCDRFGPKIVQIRAIVAIFRPFEVFLFLSPFLSNPHISSSGHRLANLWRSGWQPLFKGKFIASHLGERRARNFMEAHGGIGIFLGN